MTEYLEYTREDIPVCSMDMLCDLFVTTTKGDEEWRDVVAATSLTKLVRTGGINKAVIAATTSEMPKEEAFFKRAGFREAFSYEGNHGSRVTLWVKGSKDAKLRMARNK